MTEGDLGSHFEVAVLVIHCSPGGKTFGKGVVNTLLIASPYLHMYVLLFDADVLLGVVVVAILGAHGATEAPLIGIEGFLVELIVPYKHTTLFVIVETVFFGFFDHFV